MGDRPSSKSSVLHHWCCPLSPSGVQTIPIPSLFIYNWGQNLLLCLHLVFKECQSNYYDLQLRGKPFFPFLLRKNQRLRPGPCRQSWGLLFNTFTLSVLKKKGECFRNLKKAVLPILSSQEVAVLIVSLKEDFAEHTFKENNTFKVGRW